VWEGFGVTRNLSFPGNSELDIPYSK